MHLPALTSARILALVAQRKAALTRVSDPMERRALLQLLRAYRAELASRA